MTGSRSSGLKRWPAVLAAAAGRHAVRAVVAGALVGASAVVPALAQGWWPFGGNDQDRRPVPQAPVYGNDPGAPRPPQDQAQGGGWTNRNPICYELEQRLVQEGQRGSDSRTMIPAIENELRQADQAYRQGQQQLDRNDCYEYFLFSKTLRRTKRCVDLANQSDDLRRRLDDLEDQLKQLQGSVGRSHQDEIVRELARNNCGANYQQQARRHDDDDSIWEDEESSGYRGGGGFGTLPYATYRTVCVRLCDGYYFPVSFSTLPNHFQRDEEVCQSKCAAPAELYYHQNPGAGMDQAVAARTNELYTQLKSAFRYRKEFVSGCSCKMAEYVPEPGAPQTQQQGSVGSDGWAAQTPTGSTAAQQAPEGGGQAAAPGEAQLPWTRPQ